MSKWRPTETASKARLTPYQKIMRAAKLGRGVRLTADEVFEMSMDDAISTCALGDDEPDNDDPSGRIRGRSSDG